MYIYIYIYMSQFRSQLRPTIEPIYNIGGCGKVISAPYMHVFISSPFYKMHCYYPTHPPNLEPVTRAMPK